MKTDNKLTWKYYWKNLFSTLGIGFGYIGSAMLAAIILIAILDYTGLPFLAVQLVFLTAMLVMLGRMFTVGFWEAAKEQVEDEIKNRKSEIKSADIMGHIE